MYTYDEWGNSVLHIHTGKKGMEMLKEAGIYNTMTAEEYKKHIDSHYKIQKTNSERLMNSLLKMLIK